jgi:hypothetical protein
MREALKLADDAEALIRESRLLRIKAGAAALVEGITARPLEDEKALEGASPGGKPGRLKFDPEARARRQAAMGRALVGVTEGEVIVILGASHDRRAGQRSDHPTLPRRRPLWVTGKVLKVEAGGALMGHDHSQRITVSDAAGSLQSPRVLRHQTVTTDTPPASASEARTSGVTVSSMDRHRPSRPSPGPGPIRTRKWKRLAPCHRRGTVGRPSECRCGDGRRGPIVTG